MPTIIIKTARDRDQYMGWTTVAEGPVWIGNRAEASAVGERMDRADRTGTSAEYGLGGWDDSGLIYMQRGIIRRDRLAEAADWWVSQGSLDADLPSSFMEPFDDEDEVREP